MKIKTLISIAAAFFLGCISQNTGIVDVDYEASKANGFTITKFVDNPLHAHIYYECSIESFDPSRLDVILTSKDDGATKLAKLLKNEAGYVKILAIDDIGTYTLQYNK